MTEGRMAFANIVGTPTASSWSQTYNAGRLFAVLSLTSSEENTLLASLGKDVLKSLEEEYFTLETKDLASIKEAVSIAARKIPPATTANFVVCSIIDNVLYGYGLGNGKIVLKRADRIGTVLTVTSADTVVSVSGFLEDGDMIVLATHRFLTKIPLSDLEKAIDHQTPADITELLSPKIHEDEEPDAAAIIVSYHPEEKEPEIVSVPELQEPIPQIEAVPLATESPRAPTDEAEIQESLPPKPARSFSLPSIPLPSGLRHIPHNARMFLTLAVILVIILAGSIYFSVVKTGQDQTEQIFQEAYTKAQKEYDEATAVLPLNKALARDDFLAAKKILEEAKPKLPADSSQRKQVEELLQKVSVGLTESSNAFAATVKEITDPGTLLTTANNSKHGLYTAKNSNGVYVADNSGVYDEEDAVVIKNSDLWKDIGGLSVYLGHVYVLDKDADQIFKFTGAKASGKADYFSGDTTPTLGSAVSLAIDGSVWILLKDGAVQKFTRGKADEFSLKGLDTPLQNPTRIFTDADTTNVYILDNENARVAVFNKEGNYTAQYAAEALKDAREIDVLENEKKLRFLSKDKFYEISIK